jgi:simple sugar transport system permease protein
MKIFFKKEYFKRNEFYIFVVLIVLSLILTLINPTFLTFNNIFDLLRNNSFLGILALGELIVLISGGIDVSFTAITTVSQYIMGLIITSYYLDNIFLTFLIPIPIGIILGLINAVIIYLTKVHPVIITIATLNIYYGLLIFFTGGKWMYSFPPSFTNFAYVKVFQISTPEGITGLSIFTLFWFLLAILTWVILRCSPIGRKIYAYGGNAEAARRAGFNILNIHLFIYGYMGLLSGIAGFVHAQLGQIIQPNAIVGQELDVIAAVILGGASISGGSGSVLGTILGVLLFAVIKNGLILMKLPSYWHQVVVGLIIAIAASFTAYQSKMKNKRMVKIDVE